MQTAKNAAATAMESAANVAASAKAGKDKTMATAQEKVERMTAKDPMQKDMATQRKQEKIQQANSNKQEAMENNAASRQAIASGGTANFTATGQYNNPGAGTQGYTAGGDGLNTQTRPTGGQNPVNLTGSNAPGYGTGQQIHNINDVGANTGTGLGGADAVYPNDPVAGTQGYTAGGDGLNNQTRPTGGQNPVNLTGSNAPGYGTGQQTHNINDVGANTGTGLGGADAVYPNDPVAGTQGYTAGGDGLNNQTRPTGGQNPVNLTGSNAPGYGTGQQTHNINDVGANTGTDLGGADAVYPNDPMAGTQDYTAGGDGLNTQTSPTGGHNPVNLTGSNAPGYGSGQQTHNINDVGANTGTGLGGADAVYPNDPIGSGPNTTRHDNAAGGRTEPGINPGGPNDAPGTGYGTGGTYQ